MSLKEKKQISQKVLDFLASHHDRESAARYGICGAGSTGKEVVMTAQALWDRQCQVCLNAISKYDSDTGYYDNGCSEENDETVERAYETVTPCPKWKPYPYPCEFKRPGCEVYWEAAK